MCIPECRSSRARGFVSRDDKSPAVSIHKGASQIDRIAQISVCETLRRRSRADRIEMIDARSVERAARRMNPWDS